jgi:hypothetical protein
VTQSGSNQAADPNIVRVGNVGAAETEDDAQVAQAGQDNRGTESSDKVEGPLDGLGHYLVHLLNSWVIADIGTCTLTLTARNPVIVPYRQRESLMKPGLLREELPR